MWTWQLDSCSKEEVADRIADYEICVPTMSRIDAAVIARATRLQLIVQFGVGLEGRVWLIRICTADLDSFGFEN